MNEEVQKILKLNAEGTETINISTSGSHKLEQKKYELVFINLGVEGDKQPLNITALCYPSIYSPICLRIDASDYLHLLGLWLENRNLGKHNKCIDLLTGADCLYNVVIGEFVREHQVW